MKKTLAMLLVLVFSFVFIFSACTKDEGSSEEDKDINTALDLNTPVTLVFAAAYEDFGALTEISLRFKEKYPNCTIVYERLQDYEESLKIRLAGDTNKIDLFITKNIQPTNDQVVLQPYALELFSQAATLDLSETNPGLVRNFTYTKKTDAVQEIYALPLGADVRVMYANKTLLNSLNIPMPKNLSEFKAACAKLSEEGYYPIQGNPGSMAQQLLYPYMANCVANAEDYTEAYNAVNSCEDNVSELFRKPMETMYDLVKNNYYDYKTVQNLAKNDPNFETNGFRDNSDEAYARDFLSIKKVGEEYVKLNDLGSVAFMPSSLIVEETIKLMKKDYHSNIEYEVILSPLGEDGGFAYLSPASGVGINKKSDHTDWALEFLDFLFKEKNNIEFAEDYNIIPNCKTMSSYVANRFGIPEANVSDVGQVTFDYSFYDMVVPVITSLAKCNNPSYFDKTKNEMYPLSKFMADLEAAFDKKREGESK